jgi:CheY-like chemotaxis protein
LVNDILDFSKIEAGKLELERIDFDLSSMLDDFATTLAPAAQEKGVEFHCASGLDFPRHLVGDPGRLRQILNNLAGNAVKFTQRGEIEVRVALEEEDSREVRLRFSIRDTGIGIPAEKLELLFDKFTQVDSSTTRKFGGTGLGLAISKQLVELMGGRIGVESHPGAGSLFWFAVRLAQQDRMAPVRACQPVQLSGTRAMVVVESATGRQNLAERLRAWGMRVEALPTAMLALEALQKARAEGDPCRMAFVDLRTSELDNAGFARIVRSDKGLSATQLVLIASAAVRGDAARSSEMGYAGFLTKPVRDQDLFNVALALADDAPRCEIVTRHSAKERWRSFHRSGLRVLVAEDNMVNQQVVCGMLVKMGVDADFVSDGAQALAALSKTRYDLVLMDVQMPEMDGMEATRRIRSGEAAVLDAKVPVIALTAHAMATDREACLGAGMDDYLSKPVSPQELGRILEKWFPDHPPSSHDSSAPGELGREGGSVVVATPTPVVFDKAQLMARAMGDSELVAVVIDGFIEDFPQQMAILKRDLEQGNADGLKRGLHNMKGVASTVAGLELQQWAAGMEESAKRGDLGALKPALQGLEERFVRLESAMRK